MESEEEKNLSLTIGETLYPVRFHFYSSKVQAVENVSLTAGRLAGAASEALVELKQDKGQFAFDGKLTIDAEAGNHAYALAYLPAGNGYPRCRACGYVVSFSYFCRPYG